jgi:flagella basal body P-ring formation protein FlgA
MIIRGKPLPPHVAAIAFAVALVATAPATRAQDASIPRAARTLARGDTLAPADILFDSASAAQAPQLVGLVARRVIRVGELLRAPAVGRPYLIAPGQPVTVTAMFGGVTISRPGTAQNGAALGDSIHVRLDQRTTVTGVVTGPASISISK